MKQVKKEKFVKRIGLKKNKKIASCRTEEKPMSWKNHTERYSFEFGTLYNQRKIT